ncbi:hypothetical protein [Prevotella melaninogenica]|uniref:hypothetical protein n=1 Tax=Prevotella melaninogenica TaxID=28132 RepID=UPI001C5EF4CF|nr:hypothetical protein [Prevotella melaninogenica]MBW4900400.1 hypothetical protein [Prevotella melaninogenica]
MKVELQCGDTITIPEGCKAIVKGKSVVFEKEEKVQDFKDGDMLCSIYDDTVLIFKDVSKCTMGYFNSHYNNKSLSNKHWNSESFHHATEEEKQLLFDKMEEQGLKWNAEEKRVETIRWRAKGKEIYYYVGRNMEVYTFSPSTSEDEEDDFKSYNYFRIKEQAEEAARRMKEVLFQYHEEMGE